MKRNNRLSILGLTTLLGVALILFSFFYLIEPAIRTRLAWLDLAVVIAVFLVNSGNGLLLAWRREEFRQQVAAVGVLWLMDFLYSAMALGLLFIGLAAALPFKFQVVGQMTALFLFVVVTGWAVTAKRTAAEVQEREGDRLSLVLEIRREFERLAVAFDRLGPAWAAERARLNRSREDARYLASVENEEARRLEMELQNLLAGLSRALAGPPRPDALLRADLEAAFDQLEDTIRLRKGCRSV